MSILERHRKSPRLRRRFLTAPVAAVLALVITAPGGQAMTAGPDETAPSTAAGTVDTTAGCGQAPTLRDGTHTIRSSGQNRSFILDIPDGYDNNTPYRLVLGLHALGGTGQDVARGWAVPDGTWAYYGLKRLAGNSTIFVAPDGIDKGWANSGGRDVTFIDDILKLLEGDLCIDTSLRFSIGFSYGGAMSISLACSRPDVFRAVVVQSSPGEISGCAGGTKPVAYFGVHGTADNFARGEAQRNRFVANNGCTPQNTPEPGTGSRGHVTTVYEGCQEGYPVQWAAFDGRHIAAPADGASGDNTRTWVPGEAWAFITQFESNDPPPSGQRYEAESAPAVCQGTIAANHAGYSGSGFCDGDAAAGAYVEFTVTAEAAGTATLGVRFANAHSSGAARPADVVVNGSTVGTASFESTGAWTTWSIKTLTVPLNAGSNTIRLDPTAAAGLPNVDYLNVG
jgi:poly(3-hydroxybutyrate) depolymerase